MDKLQGIDLFLFRAYMEKTESGSVVTAMWVGMTELLVNLVFLFVNVAVLFFSTIMKLLEDFSVYDVYKSSIYDFSKDIWQRLVGGNSGVANNSIIFTLIGLSAIYLFVQWALSRGDFSRKVLHFLMVIGVSFAYFGTINATNGGLYVLDGIRGIAQESVQSFNNVSFQMVEGETIQTTDKFSSSYIEKTSYEAYLYVNTGRIDGKFFNNKTEELEPFPTDKILGTSDKDGNFKAVAPKDRSDKLDFLGDGALEDSERNRWMSAVPDYLFQKLAYALSTLFEALVLPIPYLMIHLIRITAEIVLLLLMLAFPLGIVLSFIPKFQDLMFGFMKAFFVTSTVPAFASLMILMCSITDRLISGGFSNAFLSEDKKESSTNLLMSNLVGAIMSCLIYFLFWKYKGIILSFFAGSYGSTVNGAIDNGMEFAGSGFPNVKDYIKHKKNSGKNIEVNPEDYVDVLHTVIKMQQDHINPDVEDMRIKSADLDSELTESQWDQLSGDESAEDELHDKEDPIVGQELDEDRYEDPSKDRFISDEPIKVQPIIEQEIDHQDIEPIKVDAINESDLEEQFMDRKDMEIDSQDRDSYSFEDNLENVNAENSISPVTESEIPSAGFIKSDSPVMESMDSFHSSINEESQKYKGGGLIEEVD